MLTRLLTAHLLMMLVAAPSMRQAMSCTINPTGIIREGVLQAQNGMVGRLHSCLPPTHRGRKVPRHMRGTSAAPCLGIEVSLPGRRHDTNLSEALGKLLDGVPDVLRSWRLPVQGLKNLGGLGLVWALGPNTSSPPGAKLPRVEVEHPPALAANAFYFHTI